MYSSQLMPSAGPSGCTAHQHFEFSQSLGRFAKHMLSHCRLRCSFAEAADIEAGLPEAVELRSVTFGQEHPVVGSEHIPAAGFAQNPGADYEVGRLHAADVAAGYKAEEWHPLGYFGYIVVAGFGCIPVVADSGRVDFRGTDQNRLGLLDHCCNHQDYNHWEDLGRDTAHVHLAEVGLPGIPREDPARGTGSFDHAWTTDARILEVHFHCTLAAGPKFPIRDPFQRTVSEPGSSTHPS